MNTKKDRLNEVYEHLRNNFGIHTKTQFASVLKITQPALSSAMNGNEAYLTKNLFQKICGAFPGVFDIHYLLTGEGELLIDNDNKESDSEMKTALELKWAKHEITILNELVESLKRENALLHQQLKGKGFDDLLNLPFHHGVADVTQPEPDDVSRV